MNEWYQKDYPTPESSPEVKQESPEASSSISPPTSFNFDSPSSPLESALVRHSNGLQIKSEPLAKRTTPCQQCRRIRRACKWIEGDQDCERCGKLGKECTGPTRRSKSTLELVRPAQQQQQQLSTVVAEIGPSSPEARWSTLHMSYSLTYHLFDVAIELAGHVAYYEVDLASLQTKLARSGGRSSELEPLAELFSLGYACLGAQLTDHSAVIGSMTGCSKFRVEDRSSQGLAVPLSLGLLRTDALDSILRQLVDRLQEQNFRDDALDLVCDKLSVGCFLLELLSYSETFRAEHASLTQDLLSQGLGFLYQPHSEPLVVPLVASLRELVRDQLRFELARGDTVTLARRDCLSIFGGQPLPSFLFAPDDLDFIYDVHNKHPETLARATAFMIDWIDSLRFFHLNLSITLAYTPPVQIVAAIRYCWDRLAHSTEVVESIIHRIFDDPRYDQIPQEMKQFRPSSRLSELISQDAEAIPTLQACHYLLQRQSCSQELLNESMDRIDDILNLTAGRLLLFSNAGSNIGTLHTTLLPVSRALALLPKDILGRWTEQNPDKRDMPSRIWIRPPNTFYAFLLKRANTKKERLQAEQDALPDHEKRVYTVQELRDMGDRAPEFVYTI